MFPCLLADSLISVASRQSRSRCRSELAGGCIGGQLQDQGILHRELGPGQETSAERHDHVHLSRCVMTVQSVVSATDCLPLIPSVLANRHGHAVRGVDGNQPRLLDPARLCLALPARGSKHLEACD